jgi:hypothetical protein
VIVPEEAAGLQSTTATSSGLVTHEPATSVDENGPAVLLAVGVPGPTRTSLERLGQAWLQLLRISGNRACTCSVRLSNVSCWSPVR